MPLYTKEQLNSKEEVELRELARELHAEVSSSADKETLIYAILDVQAEQSAAEQKAAPKRRTRIVKKDVDHVYSASKTKTESFEKKKTVAEGEPKRRRRSVKAEAAIEEQMIAVGQRELPLLSLPVGGTEGGEAAESGPITAQMSEAALMENPVAQTENPVAVTEMTEVPAETESSIDAQAEEPAKQEEYVAQRQRLSLMTRQSQPKLRIMSGRNRQKLPCRPKWISFLSRIFQSSKATIMIR